ncbi:MAG: Na/Pi cotransporter family protein [Treponema sp.]|nr:Na/Pi cotransporter family protein [Treponema sp.]
MIIVAVFNSLLLLTGSLAFLLYGMRLMSDGVQKSAGEKLQHALGMMTGHRITGLFTGLFVTMVIQSSGATTVMVISFINAGLLTLYQSVGVIFGANIGTTITAWIVSLFGFNFKISDFALPLFGAGFFLTFLKSAKFKNAGEAVMGFGLLFLGLSGLSDVFTFDSESLSVISEFQHYGIITIIVSCFIGIVITALMHSSSAFTAIVITMAYKQIISWEVACAMTFGSNIGSTIDAVLASFGSTADAKRSAVIHVLFNVFGTVLGFILFKPLLHFVEFITPGDNIAIRISMLHTVFKSGVTVILFPLSKRLVALSRIIIKDDKEGERKSYHLEFIEQNNGKESAAMHIIRVEKEIADMTDMVTVMFDNLQTGFTGRDNSFIENKMDELTYTEDYCDQMHEQIVNYLIHCQRLAITETQRANLSIMIQIVDDIEAMSDDCYSTAILLKKSIEKNMKFYAEDIEQLVPYVELAREFLQFIRININRHLDSKKLELARELENQIDMFRKNLKKVARKRLENGADVKAELLYIDLIRKIEKIGDHAFSISELLSQTV